MKPTFAHKILSLTIAGVTAVTATAALSGCGSDTSDKGLNAALAYATKKVSAFSSSAAARTFQFSDDVYAKAGLAAMIFNENTSAEDLQGLAKYLSLDSITVTNEKSEIVAGYPEGEEGKRLKETEDKVLFTKVANGSSVKLMNEPQAVDGTDEYALLAGVTRADTAGAVIIGFKTDAYSKITGSSLADECGVNVLIVKDKEVISSTLKGIDSAETLKEIGVTDADISDGSFSLEADGSKYTCVSAKSGDYTVICASPV